MKLNQTFQLSLLSATLLAVFGSVQADEIDQLTKPESSISVNVGVWDHERHQRGIYDDQRENRLLVSGDVDLVTRDDATGTWMSLSGRDLGLNTGEIRGEYLRQGDIGLSIEQSRLTRDNPLTFTTGLQGIGTTTQVQSGAGANAIPARQVSIGTQRDLTQIGFYKSLTSDLDTRISFKHEIKSGNRHWGRGGEAAFAVEPIDSTTDQLDATLNFSGEKLQVSGGYAASWYRNKHDLVSIITNGVAVANPVNNSPTYLSLPLDNESQQLFVNGGYNFTPATRGTFKVEYAEATQDENFPTNSVPNMPLVAGIPSNLSGKVETTLAQVGVATRFTPNWSALANLRYHDVNDKTPVFRVVQGTAATGVCVTAPSTGATTCNENTPFSYETTTAKAETTYRLPDNYSLTGGVEQRNQKRSVPIGEVATAGTLAGVDPQRVVPLRTELEELTWRLEARRSLSETLNGSVAYLFSERDGSDYISARGGPGGTFSDLISPIHLADRDRQKIRLAADWSPAEALSVQVVAEHAEDDYQTTTARPYGISDGEANLFSIDATYKINDNWSINSWLAFDRTEANQANRRDSGNSLMLSNLVDEGESFGLGVKGSPVSKLTVGTDLQLSRNTSKQPQSLTSLTTGAPVVTSQLPEIENKLLVVKLFAEYAVDRQNTVHFDVIHERWNSNDWTWQIRDGSPFVYGTTTDGTMVTADSVQEATFAGIRYTYSFQ
jgi:MtrB/PioB family decaheme-associated outer membrane protein